uniref:CNNM domain-containing protein n=1 Tax=uncultured Hyphomonas sp. TaxID=225298 RepID=UPI002623CB62
MIAGYIISILVLLGLSGFFSGSETALTAASRARMHQLEKDGDKRAETVNRLISNRENLIGSILLGNNLVNILASVLATSLFTALFGQGGLALVLATGVMTILVLVFSEVLPKTYAITRPDTMAMSVARPISGLVWAVAWIVKLIQFIVTITLKILGLGAPAELVTAEQEIRGAILAAIANSATNDCFPVVENAGKTPPLAARHPGSVILTLQEEGVSTPARKKRITVPQLQARKGVEPIVSLTA